MPGDMNPEALLEGLREKLRSEWQQHRRQSFNNNTKGAAYETALQSFLQEYFDGVYDIHTRTAVVDSELACLDVMNAGESELDIVAAFRQAVPGLIFNSGQMKWVPYESVAFICEVKSKLTKPALEDDLSKLEKVSELPISSNRFDQFAGRSSMTVNDTDDTIIRDLSVEYPLRCLVYDEQEISPGTFLNTIQDNREHWDIILLVEENLILLNPGLPFVEGWFSRITVENEDGETSEIPPHVLTLPDGLVWFILTIATSIPRPRPFDATSALLLLVQEEWKDGGEKYNSMVNAIDRVYDWS